MNNILYIHGISGLESVKYIKQLEDICKKNGLNFIAPSLGSYRDHITYETWKEIFDINILPYINSETIVIAHSLGTQFATKYLFERNLNVGAYISLAAPVELLNIKQSAPEGFFKLEAMSRTFKPTKDQFEWLRNKQFAKYSMYSNDDPIFEQWNLEGYAKEINSKPIKVSGKGHFGVERIDELEDLIGDLTQSKSREL